MRQRVDNILTGLTLIGMGLVVWLNLRHGVPGSPFVVTTRAPEYVPSWEAIAKSGILVGDPSARTKIVEFADFECPFCRRMHHEYQLVQQQYGKDVALVFVHFPLTQHRFARPAGRAAECAFSQGKFVSMADLLFDKQDSLGLKSWSSFAEEARIADLIQFARCVADTSRVARIEAGLQAGRSLGVNATPTVIVNGRRFYHLPPDSLLAAVQRAAATVPTKTSAF